MRNKKATCPISCRADVTTTFSAAFKAGSLRSNTFVFRGLSCGNCRAIHVLSGPCWPASAAWCIARWQIVKNLRKRMLKQDRKIAIFRNALIFVVPLQCDLKGETLQSDLYC